MPGNNRTYYMEISFWKDQNDHIRLTLKDDLVGKSDGITGITTINENESSKRGHPHIYNQLKKILQKNDMWHV